jgi:glutamate synthase (NADPH/NADH) small chain
MTTTALGTKERMAIPRQPMPELDPGDRATCFEEVNLGYDPEAAVREATRCLACRRPPCVEGCPVGVRIDRFVPLIAAGDFAGAAGIVAEDNALAAICGRVCPQEVQCEGACVLERKHRSVAIGYLERFIADWDRARGGSEVAVAAPTGHRVAVVGSGPAGLTCAADLARMGHEVTVFEALHEPGGVLAYGIPPYRLPRDVVDAEVGRIRDLGVTIETDAVIGMSDTIDDLLHADGYDAVFVGSGAGLPRFLGIPGEDLVGVSTANEFLTRVNLMKAWRPDARTPVYDLDGARVAVFGGGNTAMDSVRTALRLGARDAMIMYRRTIEDMPARLEEIHHAEAEGVRLLPLVNPVEFLGDESGRVRAVRLVRMTQGEPDASGRRSVSPIDGSEFVEEIDAAIVAIGNAPNPILRRTTGDLDHTRRGTIVVDPENGATTKPGVFAGGDIVTGGATVILAMGAGRRAAREIDECLRPD